MVRRIGMQQFVDTRLRSQLCPILSPLGTFSYNYMQSTVFEGAKVMKVFKVSLPREEYKKVIIESLVFRLFVM